MRTRLLRSLVKVSQTNSFSVAAKELGITLSALSIQMKTLEELLGVQLFDRSVRPPRLTHFGTAVVTEAQPLLQREDRLLEICRPSQDLAGRFRLGFTTTAAVRLLPGFLLASGREARLASFEFETGLSATLQDKVLTGQLDAAVITDANGLPSKLSSKLLRQEPFVFAAHASLLENGLSGLMAEQTFLHFMPETGIGKLIERAMLDYDRSAETKTIVMDNLEAIMGCVAAGLGFTLLPLPDVERYRVSDVQTLKAPQTLQRKLVLVSLRDSILDRNGVQLQTLLGT